MNDETIHDTNTVTRAITVISDFVKTLPALPGVYRMIGKDGDVLYVGKAKNLPKRVTSYTQPERASPRIARMIALTMRMEFTTTRTEAEALLLEASLIKSLKPRYNVLLRDDKSFPYIFISGNHDYPRLEKYRGARKEKGDYFGPFASGSAVFHTITTLQRIFMLRTCSDNVFASRSRPCLQYQIKRCTAPCVGRISQDDYRRSVEMARNFLQGKSRDIQDNFAKLMQAASEKQQYEDAAFYRDKIHALTKVQSKQAISQSAGITDADIIALHMEGGQSCVQVFFFRNGSSFGNRAYFPRHERDADTAEILSAFIMQFYAGKAPPRDIYLSEAVPEKDLIETALSEREENGKRVRLSVPQKGEKRELVALAMQNARTALAQRRATESTQAALIEEMAFAFGIDAPERIEVYDNSHISGTNALGVMIAATREGFSKSHYRKFNIKSDIAPGDDYAMMREVLGRRFKGLMKEDPDRTRGCWPGLILIDGGQGQLSAALQVYADMGLTTDDVPLVAIAKGVDRNAGRERFFMEDRAEFSFPQNTPVLHFLQRLRDEAHRFAIGSHRAKRSKQLVTSPLDAIDGIGAKRKKALLMHFGSAHAVSGAGIEDLMQVEGVSRAVAEKIYYHFHNA